MEGQGKPWNGTDEERVVERGLAHVGHDWCMVRRD